jgi:hypothetical protein
MFKTIGKIIQFVLFAIVTLVCILTTVDQFNSIVSGEAREKLANANKNYADSQLEVKQAEVALSKKASYEFTLWQIAQDSSFESKARLNDVERLHRPGVVYPLMFILMVSSLGCLVFWLHIIWKSISWRPVRARGWFTTQ